MGTSGKMEELKVKMEEDHRPWGYYKVLEDEPDHKVKRIVVYPGQRLSLQRHRRRSEHWFIVHGKGTVTMDHQAIPVQSGSSVDIPQGAWHRISNPGDSVTVFIEVQTGDYFGEDDIERAEDDYGR
jgi:mannose-6-phosphate isomerase-like protein (cupin superfamily)